MISVPTYYTQMDDQGVSSNIMDSDNMPIFFSENTYVCEVDGGSQRYTVKRHEFNDFWITRRGKRCDKKYAYMEKRKKRREHFQALKQHELKRERDLQAAKRRGTRSYFSQFHETESLLHVFLKAQRKADCGHGRLWRSQIRRTRLLSSPPTQPKARTPPFSFTKRNQCWLSEMESSCRST